MVNDIIIFKLLFIIDNFICLFKHYFGLHFLAPSENILYIDSIFI